MADSQPEFDWHSLHEETYEDICAYSGPPKASDAHKKQVLEYVFHREGGYPTAIEVPMAEIREGISYEEQKRLSTQGLLTVVYGMGDEDLVLSRSSRNEPQQRRGIRARVSENLRKAERILARARSIVFGKDSPSTIR